MGAFQISDSSKLRLSDENANIPLPKFRCHVVFINTDTEFLFLIPTKVIYLTNDDEQHHQQ